jgi:hypothetical protein
VFQQWLEDSCVTATCTTAASRRTTRREGRDDDLPRLERRSPALPEWPAKVDGIRVIHGEVRKEVLRRAREYDSTTSCGESGLHRPAAHEQPSLLRRPDVRADDEASVLWTTSFATTRETTELAMMINRINQIRRETRSAKES